MQSQKFDKTLLLLCFNKTKETYLNVYKSYLYVSLKKTVRHYYRSVLDKNDKMLFVCLILPKCIDNKLYSFLNKL